MKVEYTDVSVTEKSLVVEIPIEVVEEQIQRVTYGYARTMKLPDLVRDEAVLSARTWVVKVGTSVLTGLDGTLDPARIGHLAEQISAIMATGALLLSWSSA